MKTCRFILISVLGLFLFIRCKDLSKIEIDKVQKGEILIAKQIGDKYQIKGEKIRLSSFSETYSTDEFGFVSIASALDFSSGKSSLISEIFLSQNESTSEKSSFRLPKLYSGYQILSAGKPQSEMLPLLIGKYVSEFSMDDVSIAIWDIKKRGIVKKLTLSHQHLDSYSDVYDEIQKEHIGEFIYPFYYKSVSYLRAKISFLSEEKIRVVIPSFCAILAYDVNLTSNSLLEKNIVEPSLDHCLPYYLSISHDESETYLKLRKVSEEKGVEVSIANDSMDIAINTEEASGDFTRGKRWRVLYHDEKIGHNQHRLDVDFLSSEEEPAVDIVLESNSFFKQKFDYYNSKYIFFIVNHGSKFAETNSLIQAGSIYILVINSETKEVVLSSEIYTGNEHGLVNAGINENKLWISFNHNWGGNHDGDTVRRTTSGRILEIELPDEIPVGSVLEMDASIDDISFRPFSGHIFIN